MDWVGMQGVDWSVIRNHLAPLLKSEHLHLKSVSVVHNNAIIFLLQ
jgi:hypothetical protein